MRKTTNNIQCFRSPLRSLGLAEVFNPLNVEAEACPSGAEAFERGSRGVGEPFGRGRKGVGKGYGRRSIGVAQAYCRRSIGEAYSKKSGRRVVEDSKNGLSNFGWLRWAAVIVMMLAWRMPAMAQTGYTGVYYIAGNGDAYEAGTNTALPYTYNSATPETNFYLRPAADPQIADKSDAFFDKTAQTKPFLTTNYTDHTDIALWFLEKTDVPYTSGDGYYYTIQHVETGKYVVCDPFFSGTLGGNNNSRRKTMHLEAKDWTTVPDKALFKIGVVDDDCTNCNSGGSYYFVPKRVESATFKYMNTADRNQPVNYGTNRSNTSNYYGGLVGLYSTVSSGKIDVNSWFNFEPYEVAQPTITFNNATNQVTITSSVEGASIYYTTIGDTPTSALTPHTSPVTFTQTTPCTINAIAVKSWDSGIEVSSALRTFVLQQVATPTIQNNGSNAISITCATSGAIIYYTTDGTTPVVGSSPQYTAPLTENVSGVTINAIAVKADMINSAVGSGIVTLQCAAPVIRIDGEGLKITCAFPSSDVTIYYEIAADDGTPDTPTTSSPSTASDAHIALPSGYSLPVTVTAFAVAANYSNSEMTTTYVAITQELEGSGTSEDPYLIANQANVVPFVEKANSEEGASAYYQVTATEPLDFSVAASITRTFTGHFDGNLVVLSGLEHPLLNVSNGATIKNVILDNVNISSGDNVGAICGEATGESRIYNCGVLATGSTATTNKDGYTSLTNCSSTIGGTNYVGGLVGLLDGESRVINCFSYADITGGYLVGGIVGKNNVATTAATNNQKTMVMNCMFYGDFVVDACDSIAPIYNGEIITNDGDANGVNNFNYFRSEASYVQDRHINSYNCALAAETRFLQRFEFFRHLLNSNRTLAAWWATDDQDNKDEMMKWVMEPSQLGTTTPYPILKTPGKYPSVVNYEPSDEAIDANNEHRNEGRKLGTLAVSIQMGDGGAVYGPPTGAEISNSDTILIITDKDPAHFNFNYGKVQLPYYNQVGTKNYNGYRVVTGWKIVSISDGTPGSYTTGADVTMNASGEITATPYNFADRKCTNKDLYSTTSNNTSNRVFNQGAYWDVPEGVTEITIEPYWAKCVYLSDSCLDVVYKNSGNDAMATASSVTTVGNGLHYHNGNQYSINGENQVVYTTFANAVGGVFNGVDENTSNNQSVYDYAIVLIGNCHHTGLNNNSKRPFTVMSADLDFDNEPDANLILRFNGRTKAHPVRYDFINLIGLGMAQKTKGGNGTYNFGIMQPLGWFEVTNTGLFRCTQFEYSCTSRVKKPIILQGGVVEQWVTVQNKAGDRVSYFHVGGNVWFKEFHRGTHQDQDQDQEPGATDVSSTPHPPISVTGGDFDEFYLTGLYQPKATICNDNAECYINGGRFGVMAGAGMEGIGTSNGKGNITWIIDNADISEFYGGGINASKPVFGNIRTIISNSHVNKHFCGGPKFGDMENGRTVTTEAANCTFKTYFGAGYGGNSYNRYAPYNFNNVINIDWIKWVNGEIQSSDNAHPEDPNYVGFKHYYSAEYQGVDTQIDYQFIPHSSNIDNVARLWIEYVSFSLATTHTVSSTLTGCTVTDNFYGGGSLGKVDVSVTSVLDGCKVKGNVYGAGFSVNIPPVEVMNLGGFQEGHEPHFDEQAGVFLDHVYKESVTYNWEHAATVNSTETAISTSAYKLYTTEDLETLGTVDGNVTLTITGNCVIGTDGNSATGNVYGGGDESAVTGNTTVKLQGSAHILGNVYGGGNEGEVGGDSTVIIEDDE